MLIAVFALNYTPHISPSFTKFFTTKLVEVDLQKLGTFTYLDSNGTKKHHIMNLPLDTANVLCKSVICSDESIGADLEEKVNKVC